MIEIQIDNIYEQWYFPLMEIDIILQFEIDKSFSILELMSYSNSCAIKHTVWHY